MGRVGARRRRVKRLNRLSSLRLFAFLAANHLREDNRRRRRDVPAVRAFAARWDSAPYLRLSALNPQLTN